MLYTKYMPVFISITNLEAFPQGILDAGNIEALGETSKFPHTNHIQTTKSHL